MLAKFIQRRLTLTKLSKFAVNIFFASVISISLTYAVNSIVFINENDYISSGYFETSQTTDRTDLVIVNSLNSVMYENYLNNKKTSYDDRLQSIKEYNDDAIGWVEYPSKNISYPVFYNEDNKKYLRTDRHGKHDLEGEIYLDSHYGDPESSIKLLHGHNMKNGHMFAPLPRMLRLNTLDNEGTVLYYDGISVKEYEVFSVFSVNSKEESLVLENIDTLDDMTMVSSYCSERSWVECSKAGDYSEILFLNTCWYGASGAEHNLHCIVVAGRIK